MKHIKIHTYNPKQEKPVKTITIPLSTIHVSMRFLPKDIKAFLKKEGIDMGKFSDPLTKEQNLRGPFIEIENPTEKVVISLE